jgi:hypothetical protein
LAHKSVIALPRPFDLEFLGLTDIAHKLATAIRTGSPFSLRFVGHSGVACVRARSNAAGPLVACDGATVGELPNPDFA